MPAAPSVTLRAAPSLLIVSHDAHDARFHKRMKMFSDLGFAVSWLAFDRARDTKLAHEALRRFPGEILGKRRDGAYLGRLGDFRQAVSRIRERGAQASLLYCINLDNLLAAVLAKSLGRLSCKVIYEVADIQSVLLRRDPASRLLRAIERWCLRRADLLVYTSEHFMTHFLRPVQHCPVPSLLLENKIYPAAELPRRAIPGLQEPSPYTEPERSLAQSLSRASGGERRGSIRVGYFGQLRCRASLEMIGRLAAVFPQKLQFVLRGYPNHEANAAFRRLVGNVPNVTYEGPYRNPADLETIYSSVDICWGFDFCCPGLNSRWCLTNRLYEAGYFGVPILVEQDTAGGEFVQRLGSGWAIPQPLEKSLRDFFGSLTLAQIRERRAHTAALPPGAFVLDGDLPALRKVFFKLPGTNS
jgi:succinoglycan biosynthesis protein ExoL